MIDESELVPGLELGHPWIEFSRWRMAWLTALGVSVVGMVGCILAGIATLGNGRPTLAFGGVAFILCLIVPILCGVLVAMFGPWLCRFFPFSQALLFGGMALATLGVLAFLVSLVEWLVRSPCEPNTYCAGVGDKVASAFFFLFVIGLPTFLAAAIGFALAQWSPTQRGTKVFWPLFAGTLLVYMTTFVLATLGAFASQTEPESSMSCGFADAQGNYSEMPCGEL